MLPDVLEGQVDIVLGVSVTTTTVRMVLIEGEKADGVIIECATFDTADGDVKASPSEQISARILAIQHKAVSTGHHLVMSGVTWDDEAARATLSDGIASRDLQNVVLLAEQNAAGALARTVGRALGYDTMAVLVMKPGTATLSVVDSDNGSIVEARMCAMDDGDEADVLPTMAATLETRNPKPGSVFVVGSRSSVCSVKSSLERLISQPVIVPEEPEFALARGAALAAANVPDSDASTCGLAYSQDPDELAALDHAPVKLADADTQVALFDNTGDVGASPHPGADPRLRIPIGNVAAATLVIGAVTLAMLVAAKVQPFDRNSVPAGLAEPSALVPELPVTQSAAAAPAPAASAAPPQQTPVPLSIPVATPAAQPAPAPPLAQALPTRKPVVQIRQPAPSQVIAEPTPVAVEMPLEDTSVAVEPEAAEALPAPPPVAAPPPPIITPPLPPALPPLISAPTVSPAAQAPPLTWSPWTPPWLPSGSTPSQQQASRPFPDRQWLPSPVGPQQEVGQWLPQHSPLLHILLGPQLQSPQPQQMPSLVPQWTPAPTIPQWTPSPVVPQWTPVPSLQAPIPVTSPSPYQVPLGPSSPSGTYLVPPVGLEPTLGGY